MDVNYVSVNLKVTYSKHLLKLNQFKRDEAYGHKSCLFKVLQSQYFLLVIQKSIFDQRKRDPKKNDYGQISPPPHLKILVTTPINLTALKIFIIMSLIKTNLVNSFQERGVHPKNFRLRRFSPFHNPVALPPLQIPVTTPMSIAI